MSETSNAVPNPGSPEAQTRGCTCPVIDNHHGEGVPTREGRRFWMTAGCPLHAPRPSTAGAPDEH